MIQKKILFISRHAPYGNSLAKDCIDALLAASAYNQILSLLFLDDGVFQLLAKQDAKEIQQKSFSSMLPALELYDIERIYALKDALISRGISPEDFCCSNVTLLSRQEAQELIKQQDQLLSF
jgi:tRNA 2-thiouridine synthesizing protein C